MEAAKRLISAGDLEKFSYCPLSWWLSKDDDSDDEALAKGVAAHEELGESLWDIEASEKAARQAETMVFWYAVVATIIAVLGLELLPMEHALEISEILGVIALIWVLAATYFLYRASRSTMHGMVLEYEKVILAFAIVAVIIAANSVAFLFTDVELAIALEGASIAWLMGASYFLYRSLKSTEIAEGLRKEFKVKGKLEYIDVNQSKVFKSVTLGLSGSPDYIIKLGENIIPVEEKKGRTPRGPLFSHILQIAAYCALIEEAYGTPPPYGLLKYPEHEHEIEYNDDLRKMLTEKLEEMRRAIRTGEVHRDHERPGKCRYCSRREGCPEKLE